MSTEKRIFDKLFKAKTNLSKKATKLAVRDDLKMFALNLGEDWAKQVTKTIDNAINVNNVLDQLTDDVRFYNDYYAITYEDLSSQIELLDELLINAENLAEELGVEPKEIDGYVMAITTLL